jgi:hypothetical protein
MKVRLTPVVFLTMLVSAAAQQVTGTSSLSSFYSDALPDAPSPQEAQNEPQQPAAPANPSNPADIPFGPLPAVMTRRSLTANEKFTLYTHQTFGPPALVFPAFGAGIRMAHPPKNYPRDWMDGAGAFGRLYGSSLASQTSKRTAAYLTASLLHEDPRYLPAVEGSTVEGRLFHALVFTIVNRTDSGAHTFAFDNFASAAAGGFVGMAYLPNGFNDVSHAGQRALSELLLIAGANVSREFAPQWAPITRKLHIPKIIPPWWVPEHP